ncbi:MAG: ornithine--oxo-acid transaminase [Candidatus Eremiobacteraeota bacterium]|nr:ornithine--oxo-acid transaminase [Candidatus Eremiobacteraeota bacterium]
MNVTNSKAHDLIAMEQQYGAHNYAPLDLVVERAEGVWLYDVEGKRYLDCISAYSAVNQGHAHPKIQDALIDQAKRVSLVSRAMRNARLPGLLQKLTALCGFDVALPMNTGAEAVETAIKLARRYAYDIKGVAHNQAEIIVFNNNFHGRTTSIISASSDAAYKRSFGPFTPGFVLVEYGNSQALAAAINQNTAAILIEPIQGEGGVNVPPEGFLKQAWALCKEHAVLFIADEIQTGLGRTGTMFAVDHDGITPDVLIVGKALGGGYYPVSAALARKELMDLFQPGDHGSTFGGNPLACAVAEAALDVIINEKLSDNARKMGDLLMNGLRAIKSPFIKEVRGRGLLVGIEFTRPAKSMSKALLERGVAAKDTHANVLRLAPPLVITAPEIQHLLEQFESALNSLD